MVHEWSRWSLLEEGWSTTKCVQWVGLLKNGVLSSSFEWGRNQNIKIHRLRYTSRKDYKTDGCKIAAAMCIFDVLAEVKRFSMITQEKSTNIIRVFNSVETAKWNYARLLKKVKKNPSYWNYQMQASCWFNWIQTQSTITCSKLIIETLEQGVEFVQS